MPDEKPTSVNEVASPPTIDNEAGQDLLERYGPEALQFGFDAETVKQIDNLVAMGFAKPINYQKGNDRKTTSINPITEGSSGLGITMEQSTRNHEAPTVLVGCVLQAAKNEFVAILADNTTIVIEINENTFGLLGGLSNTHEELSFSDTHSFSQILTKLKTIYIDKITHATFKDADAEKIEAVLQKALTFSIEKKIRERELKNLSGAKFREAAKKILSGD